jgi:hypothetical protein
MTDELDFSLDLSPLPSKEGVSLSEAMQFLRYGGVLKVWYKGDIPAEQIEKGHLTVGSDGHYLLFVHGRDDALFGPHRSALETAQGLMLAAHDLPNQPDAYETLLQQKLNEAARSGKLRVHGLQVDEPLCLAPSPARPRRAPSPIDAEYFHIDRCFDDEYGRIHYVDPADSEAMEEDLIASLVGDPMHSYSNVTLDREGLLALAAEIVPELVQDEVNKTQQTRGPDALEAISTIQNAETMAGQVASGPTEHRSLSNDEALAILERERVLRATRGDERPIPQNDGVEILRKEDPTITRERGRSITKSFTGNDKPGPTGPRRNYAG